MSSKISVPSLASSKAGKKLSVSSTGPNGPHTTGHSLDISVKNSQHRKQLIDHFATKVTGLGVAKTFIHIDNLTEEQGFDMRPNAWKY